MTCITLKRKKCRRSQFRTALPGIHHGYSAAVQDTLDEQWAQDAMCRMGRTSTSYRRSRLDFQIHANLKETSVTSAPSSDDCVPSKPPRTAFNSLLPSSLFIRPTFIFARQTAKMRAKWRKKRVRRLKRKRRKTRGESLQRLESQKKPVLTIRNSPQQVIDIKLLHRHLNSRLLSTPQTYHAANDLD